MRKLCTALISIHPNRLEASEGKRGEENMSKSIPLTPALRIHIVEHIIKRDATAEIDDAMDCGRATEAWCYGDV